MNKNKDVLIIFVRAPRLKQVKTRLEADLGPRKTLELYQAMVMDLVSHFTGDRFDVRICFTPGDAHSKMEEWLGKTRTFLPQEGEDLGSRMDNAFAVAFGAGYRKAVIIGSDLPSIDALTVSIALTKLDVHDVVLGPSSDGGYYLVALKQRQEKLFQNIEWGTSRVLPETIRLANEQKLSIFQMEQRTDMDTFSNLIELWKQFQWEKEHKDSVSCPKTYEVFNQLFTEKQVSLLL